MTITQQDKEYRIACLQEAKNHIDLAIRALSEGDETGVVPGRTEDWPAGFSSLGDINAIAEMDMALSAARNACRGIAADD